MRRAFRFRLYPTAAQAERLTQYVGATRFVYNLAWEQRRDYGRRGRNFGFFRQDAELTALRSEVDWLADMPRAPLSQALRDLDRAFSNFFVGRARYPSPRHKGRNDSFRIKGAEAPMRRINARWSEVLVPKLGRAKFRHTRDIRGRIVNATFSSIAGQWFVSFSCEIEHEAVPSLLPAVGIDRGITNTIALSTGELLSTPATDRLEQLKKRAQRVLARRKRGSMRYLKQRLRVARIAAKIARVRTDWRHKTTTDISLRFGTVALEDLQTKNMVRANRGLARSIHEQGWRSFETALAYKLDERGGALIKVNPAYTSQECSACGAIDKASRESQASFACRHCGFAGHADTNAALNILRRSTAPMRAEGPVNPVETRTARTGA